MNEYDYFQNPLDLDILGLLMLNKLPVEEKRVWINVMPHMTEDEKKALIENLQKEIQYEEKVEDQVLERFVAEMIKQGGGDTAAPLS